MEPSRSSDYDARDQAVRRHFEQSLLNSITHSVRNSAQDQIARVERLLIGCRGESIQLFLQLRLA